MRAPSPHLGFRFITTGWQASVLQTLEERHLVAWSPTARVRTDFAAGITQFLSAQPGLALCVLQGRAITSLDALCHQFERQIPGAPLDRRIGGTRGLTALLREHSPLPGRPAPRQRVILWNDADILLRADEELFGRVVDVISGTAAEMEYASDDHLLVQRGVYVGGPTLKEYASDARGQFQRWHATGDDEAFWSVVSGLERPPMQRTPIEQITGRR